MVVFDGAMGTMIQNLGLGAADYGGAAYDGCPEILALTQPEAIRDIHRAYLRAGADVIETDTFTGTRLKLNDYHLGDRTHEINLAAARLARRVADEFSRPERPRFVAGSIDRPACYPPQMTHRSATSPISSWPSCTGSRPPRLEGGVDLLVIETSNDILEVRAAIAGIRRAFADLATRLPIQAQVTLDTSGRMLLGTDIAASSAILSHLGVDIAGLNCSTGPEHMREPVRYLTENLSLPISTIPNAGLPLNIGGKAVYPMQPQPMAEALGEFVGEFGVNVVGGCCGTTPEHIQALTAVLAALDSRRRQRPFERVKGFELRRRASEVTCWWLPR